MNNITLTGRIGQPPETHTTASGLAVTKLSLAVDRRGAEGVKLTDWFTLKTFGKTAEVAGSYATVGRQLAVKGAMVNETWTDKDGRKRDAWVVLVDQLELGSHPHRPTAGDPEQASEGTDDERL